MYNLLLSLMSTHNQFAIVQQLYDDMKKIGLPDTEPAYTCVMRCFAQEGRPEVRNPSLSPNYLPTCPR
jgi:hypothetical protein